ncbi:DNA polymerase zeta catalytic subunit isoform X1 [Biomphalaria glabrata]|nr:DNA polymerase zeta catalytic subunit isoform X1 [Biomphalaria glabrata]
MFSLRIVATNYYLAPPIKGLDIVHSEFRDSSVIKIPVLQIFGSTPAGQKTCMHIHGAFPYLYVPYGGTQPEDRFLRQFATSLDRALNIANGSSNCNFQHVYKISVVSGIPIYGYHAGEEQFLKIYFYNPNNIKKASELLLAGAVMNKPYQPHNSHISYPLQVFIDYNLYGMNFVSVGALKFRKPITVSLDKNLNKKKISWLESDITKQSPPSSLYRIWHTKNVPEELYLPDCVVRQSTCELEVDVVAADIINKQDLNNPDSICVNQGLAALWENVKEKTNVEMISQDSNREQDANIVISNSERKLLERFQEIVSQQLTLRPRQPSQLSSINQSSEDSHIASTSSSQSDAPNDECPVIDAVLINRIVSSSQSFTKSQRTQSDSQDISVTNILASLLDESVSLLPSQIASLEEQDSIINNSILLTEQDEKEDEAETQLMQKAEEASFTELLGFRSKSQDFSYDVEIHPEEDPDSEVELLPQFDGASDRMPNSNNSKSQKPMQDDNTVVSDGSEPSSALLKTTSIVCRDGEEVSGSVLSNNASSYTAYSDGSDASSSSGVVTNNSLVFNDSSESSVSNNKMTNSQSSHSGNKTWSQPGWSNQASPWSGEYMGWNQTQNYQNWNQRQTLPTGYSQRTTSQSIPHNVYSPQHSFSNTSPQYQYPHYTSPTREQQFQQCYQSPVHMPYQSPPSSQATQLYQSPTSLHPYNSPSHYLGSAPSKPYQSYQLPQVDQAQTFRPFQLGSPNQSPRGDTFQSSNSQMSSYSSSELGENYPLQQKWLGSHVSSQSLEANCLAQSSYLKAQSVDTCSKEDTAVSKICPKSECDHGMKMESSASSSAKVPAPEHLETKVKLETTVSNNSTSTDLHSHTGLNSQVHLDSNKPKNFLSLSCDSSPVVNPSVQKINPELKHFATSSNICHIQSCTIDNSKFSGDKTTCIDMSNSSDTMLGNMSEESVTNCSKINTSSIGVNTSTPMMQQLLMEESTVRMTIKKDTKETTKKNKPIMNQDLPKPKKKYTSKAKMGSKNSRPRSTSLSTFSGPGGFNTNPSMPIQPRSERAHSISFPFNNDPSFSGSINNQSSRWLQQSPQHWSDQSYSQMYHQHQWDTNQWQSVDSSHSGYPADTTNTFQQKPYISEPPKSPYHQSQPLVSPDIDAASTSQSNFTLGQNITRNSVTSGSYDKSSLSSLFQLVSDMNTSAEDNYMITKTSQADFSNDIEIMKQTSDVSYTQQKDFITLEPPNKHSNTTPEPSNRPSNITLEPPNRHSNINFELPNRLTNTTLEASNKHSKTTLEPPNRHSNITLEPPNRYSNTILEASTINSIAFELPNKNNTTEQLEEKNNSDINVDKPKVIYPPKVIHPCLGKQSRLKRLGFLQRCGNDDSPGQSPNLSYTYTFHVPTPVFKKLKFHLGEEARKHKFNLVRMHPMDARRYSLLKIGREIVKVSKLGPEDLAKYRVIFPVQPHLTSTDGSTNRVNLNIPTVSVDKSLGDSVSDTNSLSNFDTDFPPNKVAPPSSFHASQLNSRVRSNSSSSRTSQGFNFSRSLSANTDQRMGLSQQQNYGFFYHGNVNSTTFPIHSPMSSENVPGEFQYHPRGNFDQKDNVQSQTPSPQLQGSSYTSCQDYSRSQYYYQQSYCEQQQHQPYYHHMQQSPSQQAQECYNNSQTESKNDLRSPVQHGTSSIDSGCVIGHSDEITVTSTINNRVNAGKFDSHAETLASNLAADSLNEPSQSTRQCHCSKYSSHRQVNKGRRIKGKKHQFLLQKLTKRGEEKSYPNYLSSEPESVFLAKANKLPVKSSYHSTIQPVSSLANTSKRNTNSLEFNQHTSLCSYHHYKHFSPFQTNALKTLRQKKPIVQQQSKRILRNLKQRINWQNNLNASKKLSVYTHKLKQQKKRGRKVLKEGIHYVIIGKFKGDRIMLVKINKVELGPQDTVKASIYEDLARKDIVRRVPIDCLRKTEVDLHPRFGSTNTSITSQLNFGVSQSCKNDHNIYQYDKDKACLPDCTCQNLLNSESVEQGDEFFENNKTHFYSKVINDNVRKYYRSTTTTGNFFCQFQECYLRHKEAKDSQHPLDCTSHHMFFKGVKHSFFKSFQMKLLGNMKRHTSDYYSSSSDDEDDFLDAVIIKEKIRNSNQNLDYVKSFQFIDTETSKQSPVSCQTSFMDISPSALQVVYETIHHIAQHVEMKETQLDSMKSYTDLSEEEEVLVESDKDELVQKSDQNEIQVSPESGLIKTNYDLPSNPDGDKEKTGKDDFLKRQMAFFEDISSDSDSGDTIIMSNYQDQDVSIKCSTPLSTHLSNCNTRLKEPSVLHVPFHQSLQFGCDLASHIEATENKYLASETVSELRSDDVDNFSSDSLVEDKRTDVFETYQACSADKKSVTDIQVTDSEDMSQVTAFPKISIMTDPKTGIPVHSIKLYSRKKKSVVNMDHPADSSIKDTSTSIDTIKSGISKEGNLKETNSPNRNHSVSSDDVSPLTENTTYSRNKCLRQKKRIKYVFYPEELSTSDSSNSSSDDYEQSRKYKKGKRSKNIHFTDLKKKCAGSLSDDYKQVKTATKSRSSRGRKKKPGDGKLLKSLSLLHMATLANLTDTQGGEFMEVQASNYESSVDTVRHSTSTASPLETMSQVTPEVEVSPSSSNQKKTPGTERNTERLLHFNRSLKPGCNGASNLGSRPLPFSRLSSVSSTMPSSTLLNTTDVMQYSDQPVVNEDSSNANTLQLLETRRAQVNCASFSMKDILRLATSEDSLDSDSKDSMPLLRPPACKRAKVKSTTLSISDIVKLNNEDSYKNNYQDSSQCVTHDDSNTAMASCSSMSQHTVKTCLNDSLSLVTNQNKLSTLSTKSLINSDASSAALCTPLSLINNIKSTSTSVFALNEYKEQDQLVRNKPIKLGKNTCDLSSMKENSFQEQAFANTQSPFPKSVKPCSASDKSTSLKEIKEKCHVNKSIHHTQTTSADLITKDEPVEISHKDVSSSSSQYSTIPLVSTHSATIPRISITCDETVIRDNFNDTTSKSAVLELAPITTTVSENYSNNCLSCLQKPSSQGALNLSVCKKCHTNYSPITPTSPMSPADPQMFYTSPEFTSPYKKTKPLWYPWLTIKNNPAENSSRNYKENIYDITKNETKNSFTEVFKKKIYTDDGNVQIDNRAMSSAESDCFHMESKQNNSLVLQSPLNLSQNKPCRNTNINRCGAISKNMENTNVVLDNYQSPFHVYTPSTEVSQTIVTQNIANAQLVEEPSDVLQKKSMDTGNTARQSKSTTEISPTNKSSEMKKIPNTVNSGFESDVQIATNAPLSKNATRICICPSKPPPSYQAVLNDLHDYGFHKLHSAQPFFSNHEDLTNCPKELLGRVFKVESNRISALPPFSTFYQLIGISEWQNKFLSVNKLLSQTFKKSLKNLTHESEYRKLLSGNECIKLMPMKGAPLRSKVQRWLASNAKIKEPWAPLRNSAPVSTAVNSLGQTPPDTHLSHLNYAKSCEINQSLEDSFQIQPINDNTISSRQDRKENLNKVVNPDISQHHTFNVSPSVGEISQIDGPTPLNTFNFKVEQNNFLDSKSFHKCQNITVLSLELHIETRGDLKPDPELDPVLAVFYSVQDDSTLHQEIQTQTGLVIIDKARKEAVMRSQTASDLLSLSDSFRKQNPSSRDLYDCVEVDYVEDEAALLNFVIQLVQNFDPDILVGYEIQMLSWGYLVERAKNLNIDLHSGLLRAQEIKEKKIIVDRDLSELRVTGRIVLNLWQILRHEVTLNIYTFENASYHILHRRIPLYSFHSLTSWYSDSLQRWRVLEHYLKRVQGQLEMINQLDIIGKTSEFARIYGIEFYDVLSRGTQIRVESMMLRFAKAQNYVSVSPSISQRARQRAAECIPLTLEPESKYYTSPVVVLDFQSLYPSIMIAYNYCYSTCLGRLDCLDKINEGPFEFGCTSLNIKPSILKRVQKQVTISPNGVAFVKSSIRKGVLPKMLEEILSTRLMVKKSMKVHKDDKDLFRMLNARQLGLKLISNVTYGYTGASFSGRMPCIEVGDSIVRKARESLERAIEVVQTTSKWKAHVIYGDTDSLFIHFPGCTKEEAFVLGNEVADTITEMFPSPMKLKFEKVYLPCVLQTKKRYFGYMYETLDQKEPTFDAKGIETVRRDSCSAVSKILERTIKILFTTNDLSRVKSYIIRQLQKLLDGKVNFQDLIFAKEFRGMMGYKPAACVPSLEIARRRIKVDRRSEPRIGERVPYVIIIGSPGLALIQLVREPIELINDTTLRLNANYYITKHILPPLDRIFSLIGVNVQNWYQNMPKIIRVVPMVMTANTAKQGTISQFYTTSNCPICDVPTKRPVCESCCLDSQGVVFKLTRKMYTWDRTYQWLTQICSTCQGTQDKEQKCISLDCPILYRRNTAQRDLSRADYLQEILNKVLLQ